MTDVLEPLVPAECNMSGNDWFPLHFDRLRKSKWWRRASDMARARNIMLWGEAYKQVPAGSMPDDDDELAEAAGFGMDVEAFIAAKAEIMAPWKFCSDGRWYHPTVCEMVLDAWERASERRKKDALKKAAQRAKVRGQPAPEPDVPGKTEAVPGDTQNVPGDTAENPGDIGTHARTRSTEQTRQDRTPQPPAGGMSDEVFEQIWSTYPDAGRKTCAKPLARQCADDAVRSGDDEVVILAGAQTLAAGPYIRGGGKPRRIDRWLRERLYANEADVAAGTSTPQTWPGPEEIWKLAVDRRGEDWAAGYIGRTAWRDGAMVVASNTLYRGIMAELGKDLAERGYRLIEGLAAA